MEGFYWLIALVIFLIVEGFTAGLTTIWFAAGSLLAFIAAVCGLDLVWQAVIFVLSSVILLFATRPLVKKFVNSRTSRTNADSVIGREAVVTETISNLSASGAITLDGMTWTARSVDPEKEIPAGQTVVVREIRGVKCMVEPQ
ncbi:MAG: NfeD family protein [Lachnospiraceae bacterium]|nr:NfeD family protein [Lachnospiraceae bacterium]